MVTTKLVLNKIEDYQKHEEELNTLQSKGYKVRSVQMLRSDTMLCTYLELSQESKEVPW